MKLVKLARSKRLLQTFNYSRRPTYAKNIINKRIQGARSRNYIKRVSQARNLLVYPVKPTLLLYSLMHRKNATPMRTGEAKK